MHQRQDQQKQKLPHQKQNIFGLRFFMLKHDTSKLESNVKKKIKE